MKKMKSLLLFVDNNAKEILDQWNQSFVSKSSDMVPFVPFHSLEETVASVKSSGATIIVVGYHLDGTVTGMDVIEILWASSYDAVFITNTGGDGVKLFSNSKLQRHANRDPYDLYAAVMGAKCERFLYMGYERNFENFSRCIEKKRYAEALSTMERVKEMSTIERYVHAVLKSELVVSSPILIAKVLNYFISQREDLCPSHGYWVHSVSHFDKTLWNLGMKKELKTFLNIAITGANEINDDNCSDRLVGNFFRYAAYDDDPKEYGITAESIRFYGDLSLYEEARLREGTFDTEAQYLLFKLHFADMPELLEWNQELQMSLVDVKKVTTVMQRLHDLDKTFNDPLRDIMQSLYEKQQVKLEKKLVGVTHTSTKEKLEGALELTKKLLKAT